MSSQSARVHFDGSVLRPLAPLDLTPGEEYEITIVTDATAAPPAASGEDAWDVLDRMAGTVDGPPDWSAEHDHYLHGTPKRQGGPAE